METNRSANISAVAPFQALAADMGLSTATLAITWVLAQGDHVIPTTGTRSLTHFKEILQAAERQLSTEDLYAIDTALPVDWAYDDRFSVPQWIGPKKYY